MYVAILPFAPDNGLLEPTLMLLRDVYRPLQCNIIRTLRNDLNPCAPALIHVAVCLVMGGDKSALYWLQVYAGIEAIPCFIKSVPTK